MTPIVVTESGSFVSTQLGLILNPTSDGYPAQLDISSGAYGPKEAAFPPPAPKPAYASSYDTEGSIATDPAHYENREITVGMWVVGSGSASVETSLNALYKMVGQINSEGGVLKFTSPAQTVCYFDLVPEAEAAVTVDYLYLWKNRAEVTLRLMARPFWRGAEIDLGTTSETSLPWLVLTESGIDGDVPALGRLVVTDTESGGKDRIAAIVGGQSRYYDSAATAALGYQAEDLTPLGTSTKTAGATGASGAGSNVVRNTDLTTSYQAVLKSEIDATNLALTHKGTYRVWARLYRTTSNDGAVSARLEWAEGDYTRVTQNDPVTYAVDEREGVFTWANLGVVSIDPESTRWEFRLLAKTTDPGDELDADCFVLFPTEVVYTELSAKVRYQTPSLFLARSEFETEAGAITGDSAAIGGVWAGAGDADDFSVAAGVATRTAVSDADINTGRYITSGVAGFAAQIVQADVKAAASLPDASANAALGIVARYADTSNWLMATFGGVAGGTISVRKRVAGTATTLAVSTAITPTTLLADTWWTLRLAVDAMGRWSLWAFLQGTRPGDPVLSGYDAALATGGALASGKPGFYDAWTPGGSKTHSVDNFQAFATVPDAAIFAGQSLELRHDRATREDSTGSFSSPIVADGRYLKIPPSGPEGRSTRLVVMALPNDPYTMGQPGSIYDTSAQLFVTPRGLVVPEA